MTPLETASDVTELITVYTDDYGSAEKKVMINEFGDFAFECLIKLDLNYEPGDRSVGLEYGFEVNSADVNVLAVYDDDGQEIKVPTYTLGKIEKLFEQNLTFEIYRQ